MKRAPTNRPMDQLSKSITINGRRTSIRMERSLWVVLDEVAANEQLRLRDLVALVDRSKSEHGLTAALRVFAVNYLRHMLLQGQRLQRLDGPTRSLAKHPVPLTVARILEDVS
ncbi:MAG: ribbon-helix-helix domain-containing protein [Alphaproteobacteria bacterium]|nr:ribbon-helix-helix domain-containing protein [Alphaproteobacteria bacterium SS10]